MPADFSGNIASTIDDIDDDDGDDGDDDAPSSSSGDAIGNPNRQCTWGMAFRLQHLLVSRPYSY